MKVIISIGVVDLIIGGARLIVIWIDLIVWKPVICVLWVVVVHDLNITLPEFMEINKL